MTAKLGIIAGGGDLPKQVIDACHDQERPIHVIGFERITNPVSYRQVEHNVVQLGQVGKIFKQLRQADVTEIVLAGGVGRPSFAQLKLDFTGMRLLNRLRKLNAAGDDQVFSTIIEFIEERGFTVIGVDSVLRDLLISEGPLGTVKPDKQALRDIELGRKAALEIGKLDIGQAVIIQNGMILGVEAAEGTDKLISRCAPLHTDGPGGVLVKMRKPGQDTRVDLPSIGVHTIENAFASNLRGIAVEAGGSLVINRDDVIKHADELGMFVLGV